MSSCESHNLVKLEDGITLSVLIPGKALTKRVFFSEEDEEFNGSHNFLASQTLLDN